MKALAVSSEQGHSLIEVALALLVIAALGVSTLSVISNALKSSTLSSATFIRSYNDAVWDAHELSQSICQTTRYSDSETVLTCNSVNQNHSPISFLIETP